MSKVKVYEGCNFFRQRLVLAILSGQSIRITNIRHKDECPGLQEFEVSLLRLIEKIAEGTKFKISETGTVVFFVPGLLRGGKFEHDCNLQRSIGYYLELIVALAPFCRTPVAATLKGITNDQIDPSVDAFKFATLPILKTFLGRDEGLGLEIHSRGMAPHGGGKIVFTCPICKQLRALQLTDPGKITRIRGMAYAVNVAPGRTTELVESAKGMMLKFLPDVFISSDHRTGKHRSPGFGVILVAETSNGTMLTAEACSNPKDSNQGPSVAADVALQAAHLLLEEVYRGGCVDSNNQSLACLFMALGQQDVSKTLIGPMSPYTIQFLRHLRDFFSLTFKLDVQDDDEDSDDLKCGAKRVMLTCMGVGYTNLSKVIN